MKFHLVLQFSISKRSILALGDITEVISDEEADIAVLEEPEHLTWYHHGKRWKLKFRLVIGIVHTNYLEYVKREKNGQLQAFLLKYMNSWVVDIYCHRVHLLITPSAYMLIKYSKNNLCLKNLCMFHKSFYKYEKFDSVLTEVATRTIIKYLTNILLLPVTSCLTTIKITPWNILCHV